MKQKDKLVKEQRIEPMTLEECGVVMGVTRERVRQIEKAALIKLRARLEARGFKLEDIL